MPLDPLTRRFGNLAGKTVGSLRVSSKFGWKSTVSLFISDNNSSDNNEEENNNLYGGLLNYCCIKVASLIKGRHPDELKKILDINGNNFLD